LSFQVLQADSSDMSEPLIFLYDEEMNAKSEEVPFLRGTLRHHQSLTGKINNFVGRSFRESNSQESASAGS